MANLDMDFRGPRYGLRTGANGYNPLHRAGNFGANTDQLQQGFSIPGIGLPETGYKMNTGFDSSNPLASANGGEGMNFLGADGWGNLALGGLEAGFGAYTGLKQLDIAKDQLDFQKSAFNKNYNAQKQTTNTNLRDRQKRRYAENPDHYESAEKYMKKNGVQ